MSAIVQTRAGFARPSVLRPAKSSYIETYPPAKTPQLIGLHTMNNKLYRKQIPSTHAMRCFEAAARHLSFTLAAEELNMTQSAVSKQVAMLEYTLKIQLFIRIRQRLQLSPPGQL